MTITWAPPVTGGFVLAPDGGVELLVDPNDRQRRWTVALRLTLIAPAIAVLLVFGCLTGPVLIVTWPITLVTGRVPLWAHRFLRGYARASTRALAYAMLLHDIWPGLRCWSAPTHDPVRLVLPPRRSLSLAHRLSLLFRVVLATPVAVCTSVTLLGWLVVAPWAWLVTLFLGRAPRTHFYASAALLRYYLRYQAYSLMLTTHYPRHLVGDHGLSGPQARLVLRPPARLLVIGYVMLGALSFSALLYQGAPGSLASSLVTSASPRASEALSARIPGGLREFCRPGRGADQAAIAAASCDLSALRHAPRNLSYQVFPDRTATTTAYDAAVSAMGIGAGADNQRCAHGQPGTGTWDTARSGQLGSFACGRRVDVTGRPVNTVVWTVTTSNMLGTLDDDSDSGSTGLGLAELTAYWASHALTVN